MTIAASILGAIEALNSNAELLDAIVNGPADPNNPASVVTTSGGPVKTLARVAAELAGATIPIPVSALPPPAGQIGVFKIVTDAQAPDPSRPVVGGGAVKVSVFSNGVAWYPLGSPEDTTDMPPYPPRGVTLSKPFTMFGHSYIAQPGDGSRVSILSLLRNSYVFGTLANEGKAGQTTTEIANRVDDTDPTIYDVDAGLTRAQQVAGICGLDMLRNSASNQDIGGTSILSTAISDRNRAIAEFGAEWFILCDQTSRWAPIGSTLWAQCEQYQRTTMADYPLQSISWTWCLQQYAKGDVLQDQIDLFNGCVPQSTTTYDTGEIDATHAGTRGNKVVAYGPVWNFLNWVENDSVYMPPFYEKWISGAAADTAITTGGAIVTVPLGGTGGTFSLVSGDATKFALNSATGAITCVAGFMPAAPYYELVVRLTKGTHSVDCTVRLWIGKNTRGCDDRAVSRDTGGPIVFAAAPSGITSKAFSAIIGVSCGAGTDGRKMYLRGSENSAIALYRDTDNKVKLVARNTGGTIIASMVSSTTLTVASGMTWISASFDLNPGSPVAKMYFNGSDVLAGGSTLTSGQNVDWNKRGVVLSDSPGLNHCWEGTLRDYWLAAAYIDWSVSARRNERFNSGTLAAVSLPAGGAINSITPLEWTPGNLADLYWGRCGTGQDAGTGPTGVGCARHYPNPGADEGQVDGTFQPTDLGAKLVAWFSADDYGTANMAVETGDRIITWIDRIAGVTLSQASGSAARPVWNGNYDASELAVVQFAADTYWMETTSISALTAGTTAGRIFVSATLDKSGTVLSYGTNGGNTLRRVTSNGVNQPVASDASQSATATGATWLGWRVIDALFSTAGHIINVDGTQAGSSPANASMNTGTSRLRVGANLATTAVPSLEGGIRHLIWTTNTLTLDEHQKLQAWLMWDQNRNLDLPSTNPYRNYRP